MRIAQFMHESNSFIGARAGLSDFARRPNSIADLRLEKDEVGGFLSGRERHGCNCKPGPRS